MEALGRLDAPVSASIMEKICDGQIKLSSWDYHCKRLATLGLLDQVSKKQRRGATEWFYSLHLNGQRPE